MASRRKATNRSGQEQGSLGPSNFDLGAIICLADRERKQTESGSGQNCITRCEVVEPNPSIANPDHTRWHVVSDVRLCPKISPLVVDLDRISVGQLSRFSVGPGYPKLGRCVVYCQ